PEKTLFFLVSSNPWAIAATVRSRCFPVRMTLVSKDEIAEALRERGFGEDDASLLARLARGRVGWVFSQIKDPNWKSRLSDWSEKVAAIGQIELWDIFRFAERWVGEEGEESLADEESIGKRRALEQRLQGFALFFRDMLCRRWGADDLVVNPFWSHRTIDEGWSEAKLADALFFVSRIARQVRAPWNVNPILALEILGAFWARYGGNSPNSKSSQFQTANKEGLQ
ncbi:MAG: hypothetical protein NZ959_01320, partial [Armatimonadetes bacterium]|nr:hypothetical protein [Armatimonadota bacterium]